MRIAEINDVASIASELTRGLNARGHEVTLLQPRLVGAKLHPLVKPIVGPVRAVDWVDLIRRLRTGKFELAHIHYAYLGNVGVLGGFPYILHCHGTDLRGSTVFTRSLIRNALRHARHVFYATPDLARYVKAVREDCEFLPNPIDTDVFAGQAPASEHGGVFICCALSDVKGAVRIYNACRRLADSRPDIKFTAVAGDPYTAEFAALPNVRLIPRQQRAQLPGIISQHGVVLGQVRQGAVGMAELEALACGRPVVAWFNQPHIYAEEPPFVRAVDGFDIASAVAQLVDDPAMRDRLGAEGRAWIQRYHRLDQAIDRVEQVARAIIQHEPVPAVMWPPAA